MKQLNKVLMAASLLVGAFAAEAAEVGFTIKVNDPQSITINVAGADLADLQEVNEIAAPEYTYVTVAPTEGYAISSFVNKAGSPISFYAGSPVYLYVDPSMEGEEYTVTTYNLEESRTASYTLEIDDPSGVRAMMGTMNSQTYSLNDLKAGENTVKFNPENENVLSIMPFDYGGLIYSVKKDGEAVAPNNYGSYMLEVTDGCNVDVTVAVPDIDITVGFEYSEGGEGCIDYVTIDDAKVEDFNGTSLVMKAGHKLTIYKSDKYDIKGYTVNGGSQIDWYGKSTYISASQLLQDATLFFNAAEIHPLNFTLTVDDPTNVRVFNNSYPSGDDYLLDVVEGTQEMTVPDNNPYLSWTPAPYCSVDKVIVNGEVFNADYVELEEGDNIEIFTSRHTLDSKAILWISPSEDLMTEYCYYCDKDYTRFPVAQGYQVIEFYNGLNPFMFCFYYQSENDSFAKKMYVDGELLESEYGSTYSISLADGMILKYFTEEEPVDCEVSFDIVGDAKFSMYHDYIAPIEDFTTPFACFAGTAIDIIPEAGSNVAVTVGETALVPDLNGIYTFIVEDTATTLKVEAVEVGVGTVTGAVAADAPVYNTMGVKVGVRSELDRLPAGIYIVEGRKIVVR